eukprot:1158473-Pelagomonas_calceolata.AAC.6
MRKAPDPLAPSIARPQWRARRKCPCVMNEALNHYLFAIQGPFESPTWVCQPAVILDEQEQDNGGTAAAQHFGFTLVMVTKKHTCIRAWHVHLRNFGCNLTSVTMVTRKRITMDT